MAKLFLLLNCQNYDVYEMCRWLWGGISRHTKNPILLGVLLTHTTILGTRNMIMNTDFVCFVIWCPHISFKNTTVTLKLYLLHVLSISNDFIVLFEVLNTYSHILKQYFRHSQNCVTIPHQGGGPQIFAIHRRSCVVACGW